MFGFFAKIMLISLICTIIIECSIAFLLGIRKKDLLNVLLVNIMTNPILTSISLFLMFYYNETYKIIYEYSFELIVPFVEGYIYKKYFDYKKINPFIVSIILNISSYLIGLFLNNIIY